MRAGSCPQSRPPSSSRCSSACQYGLMSSTAATSRAGYRALLRRPGYPSFVLTVTVSRITATMFVTTGVLLVLVRTHSAALAGVTAAAETVTWALAAPLLGAWLDVVRHR